MVQSWTTRLAAVLAACQLLSSTLCAAQSMLFPSLVATTTDEVSESATAISSTSSSTPSSSNAPKVHMIQAGMGGFRFTPQQISNVSVGDVVSFEFYPPDHSVVRAEFGSACVPYEYTGKDKQGFWSTTQWVDTVADVSFCHAFWT